MFGNEDDLRQIAEVTVQKSLHIHVELKSGRERKDEKDEERNHEENTNRSNCKLVKQEDIILRG